MRFSIISFGALMLATTAPAMAQDTAPPPPVSVTGGITLTSDYRFRGLTQTNRDGAIQGTVNVNTTSGFYVGTWASTIDDDVSLPGYGGEEVDLYGGYTKTLTNGLGVDVGLLYYYYPDGAKGQDTDFFEPYASVSYTIGPIGTKLGAAYAWGGQDGLNFTSSNDDNIYAFGEASVGVPTTPVTLKGHLGYTNGSLGLINLTSDDDSYWDWSVTAEAVGGPMKVGVSYVDTSVSNVGGFARAAGRGSTVLGYVGVNF